MVTHSGLPPTVVESATETGIGIGIGTGIGTVTAIEEGIRTVAAGEATGPTLTTNVDTHLPRVAILEVQTSTDPVATATAHATGNAPRGTKTIITVKDLLLIDTDPPARNEAAMTMKKTRKGAKSIDAKGGIVERIRIATGGDTKIALKIRKKATTGVMVGETSKTLLQVYMVANTDLGMTPTRCLFRIISCVLSLPIRRRLTHKMRRTADFI